MGEQDEKETSGETSEYVLTYCLIILINIIVLAQLGLFGRKAANYARTEDARLARGRARTSKPDTFLITKYFSRIH